MAGDWIKMRGNLWDDPRVSKLCDLTDCEEAQIIGGLYWLWATADQHTENGVMPGLTLRQIDRKTGIQGFGQGLCDIGWLADHPEGARIINFEEHNGQSAKRRASDAQRKANSRSMSAPEADKTQTDSGASAELEKEKRREEKEQGKSKDLSSASLPTGIESPPPAPPAPPATPPLPDVKTKAGTRLPEGWALPKAWGEWALAEKPHWNADDVRKVAEMFRDHWHANANRREGKKADWLATWRNWVRNCREPPAKRVGKDKPSAYDQTMEAAGRAKAMIFGGDHETE